MGISISTKKGVKKEDKNERKERSSPVGMERNQQRGSSRYVKPSTSDSGYPTTASSCTDNSPKRTEIECASFSDLSLDDMMLPERRRDDLRLRSEFGHNAHASNFGKTQFEENINLDVGLPEYADAEGVGDVDSVRNLFIPGTVINGSLAKRKQRERNTSGDVFFRDQTDNQMRLSDDYILRTSTLGRYDNQINEKDYFAHERSYTAESTNTSDPKNRPGAARAERRRIGNESTPTSAGTIEVAEKPPKPTRSNSKKQVAPAQYQSSSNGIDLLEFITKLVKEKADIYNDPNSWDEDSVFKNGNTKFEINMTVDPMSDAIKISLPGKLFMDESREVERQRRRKVKRHQSLYTKSSWR